MVHYLTILFDYPHSFLRSTKHLGKIRRLGYIQFLHFFYMSIVLKSVLNKNKIYLFKKIYSFFILTASKSIKIQKVKFEVGFSYEDCI